MNDVMHYFKYNRSPRFICTNVAWMPINVLIDYGIQIVLLTGHQ